jgi:hypothetical protein
VNQIKQRKSLLCYYMYRLEQKIRELELEKNNNKVLNEKQAETIKYFSAKLDFIEHKNR